MSEDRVSVQQVIGNFVGNIGVENVSDMLDDLVRWAYEAEQKIGSSSTFRRYECELEVKNKRACLPRNFISAISLKVGDTYLDVTKKDFRLFNKGANIPDPNAVDKGLNNGNLVISSPGSPQVSCILFTGPFQVGSTISITISANNNGTVVLNTFTYVVQPGDTDNDIAQEFFNQISAINGLAYTAVLANNLIQLTGTNNCTSFDITPYTTSATGCVEASVKATLVRPKNADQNGSPGVKTPRTTSGNLATGNALLLNNGIGGGGSFNGYGYGVNGFDYTSNPNVQKFSIDNGYINFNTDIDRVGIAYYGVYLDDDGFPLIKSSHEDAVAHYLQYMYLSRRYFQGKLPNHVYKEAQHRWYDLCGQARGDDELPNPDEYQYIVDIWTQLLPLPDKNLF
jgi:hypothetical protein